MQCWKKDLCLYLLGRDLERCVRPGWRGENGYGRGDGGDYGGDEGGGGVKRRAPKQLMMRLLRLGLLLLLMY